MQTENRPYEIREPYDPKKRKEYVKEIIEKTLPILITGIELKFSDIEELGDDLEYQEREKSRLVSNVHIVLESNFKDKYGTFLLKRGNTFPLQFMISRPMILETIKRNKLLPFWNFVDAHCLDMTQKENQNLTDRRHFPGGREETGKFHGYQYSIFLVDNDFFESAENELGWKRNTIQAHLQKHCDLKGYLKIGRHLGNGPMIYADGYRKAWTNDKTGESGLSKIPFIRVEHCNEILNYKVSTVRKSLI